ncbi:MAG: DUF488 domain-containing protein [Leptolyngbyaceae cyanobacterium RU_5_1]|nr:DUF488 domain-containing protein [Leptolyngbyaceae cyanobacterium RU_5_1]
MLSVNLDSNHSIEAFIGLLKQHGVTVVADVRSYPYSCICSRPMGSDRAKN